MNMAKRFVITGASSDLGTTFIKRLARKNEPVEVWAHYRTWSESLEEIRRLDSPVVIHFEPCDLADPQDVDAMLARWNAAGVLPTHILHFAASPFRYVRFRQMELDALQKDMQIQVYSFAAILKNFLPAMAKQHFGRVVAAVSSCTIGTPPKCLAHYTTVKYALLGLLRSAAAEYGASGITVNGISPGMVETKFLKEIDEKFVELDAAASALKRHITPEEVMDGIDFLLEDGNAFANGINLNLSAGNPM